MTTMTTMTTENAFHYLNQANTWPGFVLSGLVNQDGVLRLASLPGDPQPIGTSLDLPTDLTRVVAMAVDEEDHIYILDLAADGLRYRLFRVDGCDGRATQIPCWSGRGSEPGELDAPRALLAGSGRTLLVADSGNHRIQVVDRRTWQLRGIWGQSDPFAPPQPGDAPGRLNDPRDLAADQTGNIYVVDYGNRRVQKFTPSGQVISSFWATMQAQAIVPARPVAVAIATLDGQERLLVVDEATNALLVYETDGVHDARQSEVLQIVGATAGAQRPIDDLIADREFLYVAAAGQALAFSLSGVYYGQVATDLPQVAGLAVDCQGNLLVHPVQGRALRLRPQTISVDCGSFLAGPFAPQEVNTHWHHLQITAERPENCHLQFFVLSSNTAGAANNPPAESPDCLTTGQPLPAGKPALDVWYPAPRDATNFLILAPAARYLWVAGVLRGDGHSSPALEQIRLEYDRESWLRFLPAIYQRDVPSRAFLDPALALLESLLDDQRAHIDTLAALFDPWAAPDEDKPNSWLDWLAGWLDVELDENWTAEERRHVLAAAFAQHGLRGTPQGLRALVERYTGVRIHLSEPALTASLWSLGETSTLGFTTMLVPAEAQGAVVGTTATLNRSHLIEDAEYGVPLFDDLAHHFCVRAYTTAPGRDLARVEQLIEREKPAHMTFHLCPISAQMRVGFQALIGVDTIVGGPLADWALQDEAQPLGYATALPAPPAGAQIGEGPRRPARLGLLRLS